MGQTQRIQTPVRAFPGVPFSPEETMSVEALKTLVTTVEELRRRTSRLVRGHVRRSDVSGRRRHLHRERRRKSWKTGEDVLEGKP